MKRLAALLALLLFLGGPMPPAGAEGATVVWDSDRVVGSVFTVSENETLDISAGVSVGFEPGEPGQPGGNDSRPILAVLGRLVLDGTFDEPVRLAANESLRSGGGEPDCLYIYSEGRPDRFFARNASFTDMIINIGGSGGRFQDCAFERCDVLLVSSTVSFRNCTFILSTIGASELPGIESWPSGVTLEACRFDGRNAASRPPPPHGNGGSGTEEPNRRTAIEVRGDAGLEGCTVSGYSVGLVLGPGSTTVRNSTVSDCSYGMLLSGSFGDQMSEVRGCAVRNCSILGLAATGRTTLTDTVVGDCGELGVYAGDDLLMANCTVFGCPTGVSLGAWRVGEPPDCLLTGNRIFGCGGYAVAAHGLEVDLSGNRFDNGTVSNGEGRLNATRAVRLNVVDPWGLLSPGACDLEWTDSFGATGGQRFDSGSSVVLTQYTLDNDGVRSDRFPYEILIRKGTLENRTVLPAGQDELTVALPVLPDLVPVRLATDTDSIRSGQEIRFLVRVENIGGSIAGQSALVFLVDGAEVDRQRVPPTRIRGNYTVLSNPWRAESGRHTVEVRLDAAGFVRENDEGNNNLTAEFSVSAAPSPASRDPSRGGYYLALTMVAIIIAIATAAAWTARRGRRREGEGPEPK